MTHHRSTDSPATGADRAALLGYITSSLATGEVSDDVRDAIALLIADAAPDRAEGLAVSQDDAPILVERLATWAARRASRRAVAAATEQMERGRGSRRPPSEWDRVEPGAELARIPLVAWATCLPR